MYKNKPLNNSTKPSTKKTDKVKKTNKQTKENLFGCAKGVLNNDLNLNEFNSLNKEIANEFLGK